MCNRAVTASWSWKSATAMWLAVSTLTYITTSENTRTVISSTEAIVTACRSREKHGKGVNNGVLFLLDFEAPEREPFALPCTRECF